MVGVSSGWTASVCLDKCVSLGEFLWDDGEASLATVLQFQSTEWELLLQRLSWFICSNHGCSLAFYYLKLCLETPTSGIVMLWYFPEFWAARSKPTFTEFHTHDEISCTYHGISLDRTFYVTMFLFLNKSLSLLLWVLWMLDASLGLELRKVHRVKCKIRCI